MFYGKVTGDGGGPGGAGRGNRNERYDQMVKQQQLIEQKKIEIQTRLEMERQKKKVMEEMAKQTSGAKSGASSSASTSSSSQRLEDENKDDLVDVKPSIMVQNTFSNDGSFLEQFRLMQEEATKKKKEEEEKAVTKKIKEEPIEFDDYGSPINKKPLIKFINPDSMGRSSPNSPNRNISRHHENMSNNSNQKNYYNVPPPPPPPPPPKIKSQNQMNDIKPYYGGGNSRFQVVPPPPPPPPPGGPQKQHGWVSTPQVRALASVVAEHGDHVEDDLRMKHEGDPLMWFLYKPDSTEYKMFRVLVTEIKSDNKTHMYNQAPPPPPPPPVIKFERMKTEPVVQESPPGQGFYNKEECGSMKREAPDPDSSDENETERERRERKRRSRWGPQATEDVPPVKIVAIVPSGIVQPVIPGSGSPPNIGGGGLQLIPVVLPGSSAGINLMSMPLMPVQSGPGSLIKATRANPQLVAYAQQAYGRIDLDEEEWKQCEEAYKMNLVFQDIARKKAKNEEIERAGKFKHEYDSDEETDGGTWEHKQRMKEMDKTRQWADELTQKAHGKHHIGDFLPPAELAKFMEKYKAVKDGERLDESEYQEFKLQQDNIGFKMLQKMGWSSGEGLGASNQGIVAPIDKGNAPGDKQGLGTEKPGELNDEDDEFTAYRKRMMLAYRFRPNPLNNPRRAYY